MRKWKRILSSYIIAALAIMPAIGERALAESGISELSEGQFVQFGRYQEDSIVWQIVHQEDDGSWLLVSRQILALKPFDATGDQVDYDGNGSPDTNDEQRANYGSNYWAKSSLREWLNSENDTVTFSHQAPDNNHVLGNFNDYAGEAGFLSGFTQAEREAIQPKVVKTLLAGQDAGQKQGGTQAHTWSSASETVLQNEETAYYQKVTDRVFIPSLKELKEYIIDQGGDPLRIPTASAVSRSEYKDKTGITDQAAWYYWLRDAYSGNGYGVRIVHSMGVIAAANAGGGTVGVVPALVLKPNLTVASGLGTEQDPYVVTGSQTETGSEPETDEDNSPDNGSDNGTGSESVSPNAPAGGINSTGSVSPNDKQTVTEKDLKQDTASGTVTVDLEAGKRVLELPLQSAALIGNTNLIVRTGTARVVIPPKVLVSMAVAINETDAKKAQIVMVVEKASASGVEPWQTDLGASLKQMGDLYHFDLYVRTEDNRRIKQDAFAEPIEVMLPYPVGANASVLGVYYHNDALGKWEYVGGEADLVNGQIKVKLNHFSTYAVMEYDKSFADLPSSHWASSAVKALAAKHIIEGVSEREFSPDSYTSRAQFAVLLTRILGLNAKGTTPFVDLKEGEWYVDAVAAANEAKLIEGRSDTVFEPNAPITREEMAVMLVRSYEWAAGRQTTAKQMVYTDAEQISDWAKPYIQQATDVGLMSGQHDDRFAPASFTTRAETAQALLNLMKVMDQSSKYYRAQ
ncbi:S-layer homology domain-containing protein [Paenibacillus sp. LjRoot153]|uniref:S-layer homology domain-containing protein n=1 Tax=Paenibacillus sp. LjRoot153 TaxID=3342270 RepID=UPI003ECC4929